MNILWVLLPLGIALGCFLVGLLEALVEVERARKRRHAIYLERGIAQVAMNPEIEHTAAGEGTIPASDQPAPQSALSPSASEGSVVILEFPARPNETHLSRPKYEDIENDPVVDGWDGMVSFRARAASQPPAYWILYRPTTSVWRSGRRSF